VDLAWCGADPPNAPVDETRGYADGRGGMRTPSPQNRGRTWGYERGSGAAWRTPANVRDETARTQRRGCGLARNRIIDPSLDQSAVASVDERGDSVDLAWCGRIVPTLVDERGDMDPAWRCRWIHSPDERDSADPRGAARINATARPVDRNVGIWRGAARIAQNVPSVTNGDSGVVWVRIAQPISRTNVGIWIRVARCGPVNACNRTVDHLDRPAVAPVDERGEYADGRA
jgi:hypothetical protein